MLSVESINEILLNNKTSSDTNINTQNITNNDVCNEKTKDKGKENRLQNFTSDTVEEKCMFNNQIASIVSKIAPIDSQKPVESQKTPLNTQNASVSSQNTPVNDQNAPFNRQNELFNALNASVSCENTPVNVQNVPTVSRKLMDSQNEPTEEYDMSMIDDCVCCIQDYGWAGAGLAKNTEKHTDTHKAEYIFMDTETTNIVNTATDMPITETKRDGYRKDSESDREVNTHVDGTVTAEQIIDDYIDVIECEEDVKKALIKLKQNLLCWIYDEQEKPTQNQDQNQLINDTRKRLRSSPQKPVRKYKKFKNDGIVKKINITPKDYPQSKITNEIAGEIQKSIIKSIDYTEELPLLECHGIQNGSLVYSCYNQKSFNLIDSLAGSLHLQMTITEERKETCHRMVVRINSFIDENIDTIFDRLETYNINLNTNDWKVLKIEKKCNSTVIHLEMNENSFKFLVRENFTLYAGIDQAKFAIIWD